jgi:hypothetical protein
MMRLGVLGVASDLRELADVMAEIGPLLTRLDYA